MPWAPVVKFNQTKAGKVKGMCLKNVRLGFGIPAKYNNAITAWRYSDQHANRAIPGGVDVPLYYNYGNDGHVNVKLANGGVWSDGDYYSSLDAYERAHPRVRYIGWSTSVNGRAVITYKEDPRPVPHKASGMPKVGQTIHLDKGITRSTFDSKGRQVGTIVVKDNTYDYTVRGINNNRVVINSASGGGSNVELALFYLGGGKIDGWSIK